MWKTIILEGLKQKLGKGQKRKKVDTVTVHWQTWNLTNKNPVTVKSIVNADVLNQCGVHAHKSFKAAQMGIQCSQLNKCQGAQTHGLNKFQVWASSASSVNFYWFGLIFFNVSRSSLVLFVCVWVWWIVFDCDCFLINVYRCLIEQLTATWMDNCQKTNKLKTCQIPPWSSPRIPGNWL